MKIAYVVTRTDAVGGASIHVRDLARAMLDRGHDVVVLAGGSGPVRDLFEREAVPFRSLQHLRRGLNPVVDFRATRELAAVLRDLQPDLVSSHTAKAGWIGRAAGRRIGLPVIYTPHGWSIGDRISPKQGVFFRLAERTASQWGPAIVCVCEQERLLALEHEIAPAEKLHVVHNGVRDIPPEMRADPAPLPVRIVSVARFAPPKDHVPLIRALAALPLLDWRLDLVGDGPRETEIRHLARELGIADRVRFLGYQPAPEVVLARAQIFALSSRSEAFPRSVLEGMRAGLPIVASNVGGVGEAVTDGVNGMLVPWGGSEALSASLAELINDAALRKRLADGARRTYEGRFRLEQMVEKTIGVYDAVLGQA